MGAAGYNAETLEIELNWIDEHIDGMPYGVDLIAPTSMAVTDANDSPGEILDMVPEDHRRFATGFSHNTTLIQPMFTTNKPDRLEDF